MKIINDEIIFGKEDEKFLEKFGFAEALEMVENYKAFNKLPFIYDAFQLASFLGLTTRTMFKMFHKGFDSFYFPHTVKKKNGGERQLYSPSTLLKCCQRVILDEILNKIPVSRHATAYKRCWGIERNAKPHIGKKYLLKMDITDFFGSITFDQVYSAAFNTRYFPKFIGVILTNFCCYNGYLPQGAPTSPALSNLVMKNFDDNLGKWCAERGITYTRYCDDITFSSDKPLYNTYVKTKKMLEEMCFEVNEEKTGFFTNANRQSVTGITVNKKLSISKEYKRKLRQQIYYILKFGPESYIAHTSEGFIADDIESEVFHLLNSVEGTINYIASIEKGVSAKIPLIELKEKINELRKKYGN